LRDRSLGAALRQRLARALSGTREQTREQLALVSVMEDKAEPLALRRQALESLRSAFERLARPGVYYASGADPAGLASAFHRVLRDKDDDAVLRTDLAEAWSGTQGSLEVQALIRVLEDKTERQSLRSQAVRSLAPDLGDVPAAGLEALLRVLADKDDCKDLRLQIVNSLSGRSRVVEAVESLIRVLSDKAEGADVRLHVLHRLCQDYVLADLSDFMFIFDDPGDFSDGSREVLRALGRVSGDRSEDPEVRTKAIESLTPDFQGDHFLKEAFFGVLRERGVAGEEALLRVLVAEDDPAPVDVGLRIWIAESFSGVKGDAVAAALIQVLEDESQDVELRRRALRTLHKDYVADYFEDFPDAADAALRAFEALAGGGGHGGDALLIEEVRDCLEEADEMFY